MENNFVLAMIALTVYDGDAELMVSQLGPMGMVAVEAVMEMNPNRRFTFDEKVQNVLDVLRMSNNGVPASLKQIEINNTEFVNTLDCIIEMKANGSLEPQVPSEWMKEMEVEKSKMSWSDSVKLVEPTRINVTRQPNAAKYYVSTPAYHRLNTTFVAKLISTLSSLHPVGTIFEKIREVLTAVGDWLYIGTLESTTGQTYHIYNIPGGDLIHNVPVPDCPEVELCQYMVAMAFTMIIHPHGLSCASGSGPLPYEDMLVRVNNERDALFAPLSCKVVAEDNFDYKSYSDIKS